MFLASTTGRPGERGKIHVDKCNFKINRSE